MCMEKLHIFQYKSGLYNIIFVLNVLNVVEISPVNIQNVYTFVQYTIDIKVIFEVYI